MGGNENCGKILETFTQLTWLQGEFDTEFAKATKEKKFERCRTIESVIENKLSEIREIFMPKEVREALNASREFFASHGLGDLAERLPTKIHLDSEARTQLERAREQGFDQYFVMPGADVDAEQLISLATYDSGEPYIEDTAVFASIKPTNRSEKPYLVCYSSKPIPQETKNLTFPQTVELFKKKGWNGLTYQEYLILQKVEYEKNGNHSFDEFSGDAVKSNWTWLLDSQILNYKGEPWDYLNADWSSEAQVGVRSNDDTRQSLQLGTRPTIIVNI